MQELSTTPATHPKAAGRHDVYRCSEVFLKRADAEAFSLQRTYAGNGGGSAGNRGDARNSIVDGGAADRFLVKERFLAQRSIDDEIHLPALHVVRDVRPAFIHLVDGLHGHSGVSQHLRRSARRDDLKSHLHQIRGDLRNQPLVVLIHADERHSGLRQHRSGS